MNLEKLCQLLLPKNTITQIKYFTALVSARPGDPGQTLRQQLFLRAISTLPSVSVHLGHFLSHEVMMPVAGPVGQRQQYVRVIKTEEKGSDVNLATHLLHDAHLGRFDVAVVVSNDSDLLEPIKIVREHLGITTRAVPRFTPDWTNQEHRLRERIMGTQFEGFSTPPELGPAEFSQTTVCRNDPQNSAGVPCLSNLP